MITRKTYVYCGATDPLDYCPENFVDQDDFKVLLEERIKGAFYGIWEKTIM